MAKKCIPTQPHLVIPVAFSKQTCPEAIEMCVWQPKVTQVRITTAFSLATRFVWNQKVLVFNIFYCIIQCECSCINPEPWKRACRLPGAQGPGKVCFGGFSNCVFGTRLCKKFKRMKEGLCFKSKGVVYNLYFNKHISRQIWLCKMEYKTCASPLWTFSIFF